LRSPTPAPAHKVAGLDSEPRACWAKTHARRKEGSRLRGLALRPEFRLKARSPSIEPPGTGDDKSRGKQSSSCRASRRPQNGPSPPTERPLLGFYGLDRQLTAFRCCLELLHSSGRSGATTSPAGPHLKAPPCVTRQPPRCRVPRRPHERSGASHCCRRRRVELEPTVPAHRRSRVRCCGFARRATRASFARCPSPRQRSRVLNAERRGAKRCPRTPANTSTLARAARPGSGRVKETAACFARTRISSVRRSSRARGAVRASSRSPTTCGSLR
jgi:hypothetical protein